MSLSSNSDADGDTPSGVSVDGDTYSEEDLNNMTIAQIKELASDLGYTITATKKADIIAEFLEQQV